jgi:hypothetical protein
VQAQRARKILHVPCGDLLDLLRWCIGTVVEGFHRTGCDIQAGVLLEKVHQLLQMVGEPIIIRIEEGHEGSATFGSSGVPRSTYPLVHCVTYHASLVRSYPCNEGLHDRMRSILRAQIVHHHHFPIGIGLCGHGTQGCGNVTAHTVGGQDDGDQALMHHTPINDPLEWKTGSSSPCA